MDIGNPHDKKRAAPLFKRPLGAIVNRDHTSRGVAQGNPQLARRDLVHRTAACKQGSDLATFDRIDDVSDKVQFAKDDQGHYEVSIPLAALGMKIPPKKGQRMKADIGVLRAENGHVNARHYWANKATAITADLPSEAELQPGFWGELEFK